MLSFQKVILLFFSLLLLTSCNREKNESRFLDDRQLDVMTASKTSFALTKTSTPFLNTYEWDSIFGGPQGDSITYDKYGEIDQLIFILPPKTALTLQRQIRKKTRAGPETIFYKVTFPEYQGEEPLWVDGRFLDLEEIKPTIIKDSLPTSAETIKKLESFEGLPFTWHGTSDTGIPELLEYYPPSKDISSRMKNDWILKGFNSLGMLYIASGGQTPLDTRFLPNFGKSVFTDLSIIKNIDAKGNIRDPSQEKAKILVSLVKPLDIISFLDRVLIVLNSNQIIESKYRSKFDGTVQISNLFDTFYGLLQKGTFIENPLEELEDKKIKKFFIRRYVKEETNEETSGNAPTTDFQENILGETIE